MIAPSPTPDQLRQMALAMHRRLIAAGGAHFAERLARAFDLRRSAPSATLDFDTDTAPAPRPHWDDRGRGPASNGKATH